VQTLISAAEIEDRVTALGSQLGELYSGTPLTLLGILTGSVVFLADLIRKVELPLQIGLIQASSYRGPVTVRSELQVNLDRIPDVADRDVILVDDIFDTGHTLQSLLDRINQTCRPRSLRSAVLLRKSERCEVAIQPDFVGFEIPNVFVVGYGLDYGDDHRHLPFIAALEPEDL
jgi:hypoxanthine phosphoribosyltransferase